MRKLCFYRQRKNILKKYFDVNHIHFFLKSKKIGKYEQILYTKIPYKKSELF